MRSLVGAMCHAEHVRSHLEVGQDVLGVGPHPAEALQRCVIQDLHGNDAMSAVWLGVQMNTSVQLSSSPARHCFRTQHLCAAACLWGGFRPSIGLVLTWPVHSGAVHHHLHAAAGLWGAGCTRRPATAPRCSAAARRCRRTPRTARTRRQKCSPGDRRSDGFLWHVAAGMGHT